MIQYWQFAKLNETKTEIIHLINRGGNLGNTSFGLNASDQDYINAGLVPVVGNGVHFDKERVTQKMTYDITPGLVTRIYTSTDIPLKDRKTAMIQKGKELFELASERPPVSLTMEDTTVINIDGGRFDKDNFKEKYQLMDRLSETAAAIKDSNNILHPCTRNDVEACYLNIVSYHDIAMSAKWTKEAEILACTTLDEINAVVL